MLESWRIKTAGFPFGRARQRVRLVWLAMILLLCLSTSVQARHLVRVATIGAVPPRLDDGLDYDQMVERMIDFLRSEIEQVQLDEPDLIVLPEACDRPAGLSMRQQFAYFETRGSKVQDFLANVARQNRCYIAFGTKRLDRDGLWRNSCVLLDRRGHVVGIYDKNYPTPDEMLAGIVAGNGAVVLETDFGRVGCAVCFDLNFDELRREYAKLGPRLIVFPSMYHGGLVQAEWAYSCGAYFVASVGMKNLLSQIRNPFGEVVASSTNYFNYAVATLNLDYVLVHLDHNWNKLRALKKKYGQAVQIHDPGEIGVVMITSECDTVTAVDMAAEFEIELAKEYFDRTRAVRLQPGRMK